MVVIMTKLFQDFALPETITSDGGPRFISDNMSSIGNLDNMAVTKALLMYRNSPDRDTGQYRAYLLLGCHLRDILPSKPSLGIASDLSSTWLEVAEYRELALDKRSAKAQEMNHIKEHAPLEICTELVGNKPLR